MGFRIIIEEADGWVLVARAEAMQWRGEGTEHGHGGLRAWKAGRTTIVWTVLSRHPDLGTWLLEWHGSK